MMLRELAAQQLLTERDVLREMNADIAAGPAIYHPSPFWSKLGAWGRDQLDANGFAYCKRTVGTRYFHWTTGGILAHQFWAVAWPWLCRPTAEVFRAWFPHPCVFPADGLRHFNTATATFYKTYVALLYDYVARRDPLRLLQRLEEPIAGTPFAIRYKGHWISQDLCNSVHEFYSLGGEALVRQDRPVHFLELGAGYGRLGHVILEAIPQATYTVVDIPPALAVSQWYLPQLFPSARCFRFRRMTSWAANQDEFAAARIRFLSAPQLALLPDKSVECFINISTLHEMTPAQIAHYFVQMDRVTWGEVYLKQWRRSRVAKWNGCVITEDDYPIPLTWECVHYANRHPIQRWFFEARYRVTDV